MIESPLIFCPGLISHWCGRKQAPSDKKKWMKPNTAEKTQVRHLKRVSERPEESQDWNSDCETSENSKLVS